MKKKVNYFKKNMNNSNKIYLKINKVKIYLFKNLYHFYKAQNNNLKTLSLIIMKF
jgi:hypothetical protein